MGWNLVLSVLFIDLKNTSSSETDGSTENDDSQTIVKTTVNGYTTDITETVKKCSSSLVLVESSNHICNGIIYSTSTKDTYIVTTASIVSEDTAYTVQFANDERVEAQLVGYDDLSGIALFSCIPVFTCSALEHGDSSMLQAGEYVIAMGGKETNTQSAPLAFGIVQEPVQQFVEDSESETAWIVSKIDTDITTRSDLDGGALVNLSGQLVGLIQDSSNETLNAVAYEELSQVVRLLQQNGTVSRGYLGIIGKDVEDLQLYQKSALNLTLDTNSGVVVAQCIAESPAQKAGIEVNDVITAIDDVTVTQMSDLRNALYSHIAGDIVRMSVIRNGNQVEVEVTLQ